jgi:hypothetical protein
MICRNCGKEIDDNATECIYCGCPTGLEEAVAEDESDRINAEEEYYEDTLEYYFEDALEDIMALYRETNELKERACMFTGDRWLDSDKVRMIYYFD